MSIDYALNGHIVTITINRPEARNSLDMEHFRDLANAWAKFRDDASSWVAVVTGVGRDFCTGADLKKFIPELTGDLPQPEGWNKDDAIHAVLHRFPVYKPIVDLILTVSTLQGRAADCDVDGCACIKQPDWPKTYTVSKGEAMPW